MDRQELSAWLRLVLTPRLGPASARRLLAAFGSPQAIFEAPPSAWRAVLPPAACKALQDEPPELAAQLQATLDWLAQNEPAGDAAGQPMRRVLSLADAAYPQALLEAADPPLLLFARGRLELLAVPAVAVVGSRHPTGQGRENAYAFARALSEAGVAIVSGLALGVDGAAHEGALDGRHGGTIAVVGTGLDTVYPKAHAALEARIAREGLVLSEFALGTPPLSPNFPKRNRVVAALTRGTLVIEAALQSGSLITARLAAEMGREVLAIPGSIHSPQARGCHALIKQGAKLVETAQDVLEELRLDTSAVGASPALGAGRTAQPAAVDLPEDVHTPAVADSPPADPILAAMGYDPVSQEALSARTGWGPAELGARLLELELMGLVARLPGQLFQRIAFA